MNPTTCGPPCRKVHVMGPRTPRRARLKPARSVAVRSTSLDTARMLGEVLDRLDDLKWPKVKVNYTEGPLLPPEQMTEPERTRLDMSGWEYGPRGWRRKPGRTNWAGLEDAPRERIRVEPKTGYHGDVTKPGSYLEDPEFPEAYITRFAPEVSEVTPEPVEGPVSRWTCGGRDSYPSAPAALQIAAQGQPEGTQTYLEECADCGGWHTEPRHVEPMGEVLCQKVRYATAQIAEAVRRVYEEIEPKCGTCGGFHLRNTRANR